MVLFSRSEYWPRKALALIGGNCLYWMRYASFWWTWCAKYAPLLMCLKIARLEFRQGLKHLTLFTYLWWSFTYSVTAVSCVIILMVWGVLNFLISFRHAATISSMLTDELPLSSDPLVILFTNNSWVASISGKSSSTASESARLYGSASAWWSASHSASCTQCNGKFYDVLNKKQLTWSLSSFRFSISWLLSANSFSNCVMQNSSNSRPISTAKAWPGPSAIMLECSGCIISASDIKYLSGDGEHGHFCYRM